MKTTIVVSLCFLACLVITRLCTANGSASAETDVPSQSAGSETVPPGAKLSIAFERKEYLLGENVLMQLIFENTGEKPCTVELGGDYGGHDRSLRFQVTAQDEKGERAPAPDPDPWSMGGAVLPNHLKPKEKLVISLPLMRYCLINHPGSYTVRATHDFGWKKGNLKAPVAETSILFRMPDAQEAAKVLEQMESLPDDPGDCGFRKSPDFADFRCLRFPVYLDALISRAKAGKFYALESIANIPSAQATAALMDLAEQADFKPQETRLTTLSKQIEDLAEKSDSSKFSTLAALYLCNRLPVPDIEEKSSPAGPFKSASDVVRQRFAAQSWNASLSKRARQLAQRLLSSSQVMTIRCGAFIIEAIGTPEDGPVIDSAFKRAMEMQSVTNPRRGDKDDVLDFPEPIPDLLRAAANLSARGYAPDHQSCEGQTLLYFSKLSGVRSERPADWQDLLNFWGRQGKYPTREAALNSIPDPLPDSCVKLVFQGLEDEDPGVCMAACDIANQSGRKEFIKPLVQIVATEKNNSLVQRASEAASSLGDKYDYLCAWADRLGDADLFPLALESLQKILEDRICINAQSHRTRAERLTLRDAWKRFLTEHRQELRSGKKFKSGDPVVPKILTAATPE